MYYYRPYELNNRCPVCGGMHSPDECPIMYPPGMPPGKKPMHEMEEMIKRHTELLEHIRMRVDEIHNMCEEMMIINAKG